jgi:epoxyqueuosine reductase
LFNYYNPEKQKDPEAPKISSYAYGTDYHFVIKDKLFDLKSRLESEIGEIDGRVFVDSAPVMDKAWAVKSGLGWMGKNTNLITRESGSWFFIAELIIDLELVDDGPIKDYCGSCTRCIDACPTDAITPYQVDGSKCISYFTIELKENVPSEWKEKLDGWAFGCDVCQDVCPWNRFSIQHNEPRFFSSPERLNLSKNEWKEMTEETFHAVFGKTPLMRAGLQHIQNSIND